MPAINETPKVQFCRYNTYFSYRIKSTETIYLYLYKIKYKQANVKN